MSTCLLSAGLRHVVVIASMPRRRRLLARALESVLSQSQRPARIVLIWDADRVPPVDTAAVLGVEHLRNRRTKGAAGAWNTGLDHLLRTETDPTEVVVSFLDDDDAWKDDYLASVAVALGDGADVAASAILRKDAQTPEGRYRPAPTSLVQSELLRANPGIQGSNLSVRLATLLEAGCFDEALPSCTDRDLCLRLMDLGARYVTVPNTYAIHDTLHGLPRLSDPGSTAKREGLDAFYAKWRRRMSSQDESAFLQRGRELFGFTLSPLPEAEPPKARQPRSEGHLELVVGVAVDGNCPERALALLADLERLATHPRVQALWLVLLHNGSVRGFERVVARAFAVGLRTYAIDTADQARLADDLGLAPHELGTEKSIAASRTLLQPCVGALMHQADASVGWILDDDARLPDDLDVFVDDIVRARDSGFDVVLGTMTDAPPIPHGASVRVQLVDLLHLLACASTADAREAPPAHSDANARWSLGRRDYYYDLARTETDRLETPFVPPIEAESWQDLLLQLGGRLPGILRGEQLFRPVRASYGDPIENAEASCFRGGSTFVFRPELLGAVPNLSPVANGSRVRRSDMVWATTVRRQHGAKVVAASIAVRQDRTHDQPSAFDSRRLHDDVVGYAFARAYEESQTDSNAPEHLRLLHKLASERLASLSLSAWRVRGASRSIRRLLADEAWWARAPELIEFRRQLAELLDTMDREFTVDAMAELGARVESSVREIDAEAFRPKSLGEPARERARAWLTAARARSAVALLGDCGEVAVLGAGREGVVVRVEERVAKVFDLWTRNDEAAAGAVLSALIGDAVGGAIPALRSVGRRGPAVVVEYDYEQAEPYTGGNGPALFRMLKALVSSGWQFTNLHPSNLRCTRHGELRIVDVGRSLAPLRDPLDLQVMVRRAMLVWRWANHPELKALLKRATREPDLPEAFGWRRMLDAIMQPSPKRRLDELVCDWAMRARGPVLDLGCGKPGRLASSLGSDLTGCDLDSSLASRWARDVASAEFMSVEQLESALREGRTFVAAVCSLVLCVNERDRALDVLSRLRRAVGPGGRVLVSVCDPTSIAVRETTYQSRVDSVKYGEEAEVHKCISSTRTTRAEVHRPLDAYRRMFARASMRVEREHVIDDIDVVRFERVGAFFVFELVALPEASPATLLIKLCAMEAETVAVQVRHLVTTLATPRAFREVVAVFDSFEGPFTRQHRVGSVPALRAELRKLQAEGWIDRVHEADLSESALRALSQRWFGFDRPISRARNGQPVAAFLSALDSCETDLVLHVDADVLVARRPEWDPIAEAEDVFDRHPLAVTLALPGRGASTAVTCAVADAPHRVEATGAWMKRSRLAPVLPLPNQPTDDRWNLPWHRALDAALSKKGGASLRRGSPACWYVTVDNVHKVRREQHLLLLDRVEACHGPQDAPGWPMVLGPLSDWLGPKRPEPMVVVVIGRNVTSGRAHRCFDALREQTLKNFGLIVIDDASDNGLHEIVLRELRTLTIPSTFVQRREPVGLLENTSLAVRELVANPEAVVVLVDLDDALAAPTALALIAAEHGRGADVVVGSMLRTDRPGKVYPADFADPRGRRGGNVWQHPRSFRRRLFDRIRSVDLLSNSGKAFDIATDWAYMLPIVEMSESPSQLEPALYLHEPSTIRTAERRAEREATIATIVSKPRYSRSRKAELALDIPVLCYHRVLPSIETRVDELYEQRGLVVRLSTFEEQLRDLLATRCALSLDAYWEIVNGSRGDTGPAFLVTFDDGYRDFAKHALPLMRRLGVPSVLFGRAPRADGLPSWAPLDLMYHVLASGAVQPTREELRLARSQILAADHREQIERVLGLARSRGVSVAPTWRRELYLSERELAGLREVRGVRLASHGIEHARGSALSPAELCRSLDESRAWLANVGQVGPAAFAYPDGDVSYAGEVERRFDLGFALLGSAANGRCGLKRVMVPNEPGWARTLEQAWNPS